LHQEEVQVVKDTNYTIISVMYYSETHASMSSVARLIEQVVAGFNAAAHTKRECVKIVCRVPFSYVVCIDLCAGASATFVHSSETIAKATLYEQVEIESFYI
jgi:hypothetical protein